MPLVDVIVPAYNAARYLPAAIESVMAQTVSDWRILLVDDGSTDNTYEVVSPYITALGDRFKYIRQENAGLPAARNTAIRNSSAEFLALLDADDLWLPHRLASSLKSFEGHPEVGLSHGYNARVDADGKVIDTFTGKKSRGEGSIAPYIYMRTVDLNCPTITFRRACVEKVGYFDETLRATEDRDMWLRIALQYQVALVPEVIAHYRISPQAMTGDPERMLLAQKRFIQKHFGAPGCGRRARRVALSWIYRQRAEALASRRQLRRAVTSALRAVSLYPLDTSNARTATSLLLRFLRITR